MSDDYTLQYPARIARQIGLGVNRINAMKHQGCRFLGNKTCVAWVREHIDFLTGVGYGPVQTGHHQRSSESKSYEPVGSNG